MARSQDSAEPGYKELLRVLREGREATQSYEALATSLHLLESERPFKSVLVTSTQPQEGKTTVAVSLALTMSLRGKKTLLIDADFRRPKLHRVLDLPNARGFADVLGGIVGPQEVIQTFRLGPADSGPVRVLDAITSGKVSHSTIEALSSPKLRDMLDYLKGLYDAVLLDSPPVLAVSDPLLLAPMVDGVLLVMNAGMAERDVKRAVERLGQAGGRILGVVINRFDEKLHGPGFHPYFGDYGHVAPDRRGDHGSAKDHGD